MLADTIYILTYLSIQYKEYSFTVRISLGNFSRVILFIDYNSKWTPFGNLSLLEKITALYKAFY